MPTLQDRYDDAMFAFSTGDWATSIVILQEILAESPGYLDAHLALGMAYLRSGDSQAAIQQGHVAEALSPDEQLVHTNLSLFYLKAGDKVAAEHHGLKARIASWKTGAAPAEIAGRPDHESSLEQAKPPLPPGKVRQLSPRPDMPWKKSKTSPDPAP